MISHPILAIDYGDARIGLACTDPVGIAIHPLATVPRAEGITRVSAYIDEKRFTHILIGLPLLRSGEEGESAQKARAFGGDLSSAFPEIPIDYIDESYSTVEAASKLHEAGLNAKKQKNVIDQAAAMEILHRYLSLHDPDFHQFP